MVTDEEASSKLVEMHAIFRGRVQGVGFRATVQYHADQLGLRGTVKNLSDGTVEVYAQGEQAQLERLVEKLQSDAGLSVVEGVACDFSEPRRQLGDFRVIF